MRCKSLATAVCTEVGRMLMRRRIVVGGQLYSMCTDAGFLGRCSTWDTLAVRKLTITDGVTIQTKDMRYSVYFAYTGGYFDAYTPFTARLNSELHTVLNNRLLDKRCENGNHNAVD